MLMITEIKVVAIFSLLLAALLFGLIPICFISNTSMRDPKHRERVKRAVGWLNAFAGGVFMGIALIHLLPEARALMTDAFEMQGLMYHFSWAEFTAAGGFFLIVFVEQIFHLCQNGLANNDEEPEEVAFAGKEVTSDKSHPNDTGQTSDLSKTGDKSKADGHEPLVGDDDKDAGMLPKRVATLRAVILLISLSLHSIFEGLAIGLQLKRKDVIDIFIAILLHKGIEAFTVSISFAQTSVSCTVKCLYCVIFSLMSPIGVAIGIPIAMATLAKHKEVPGSSLMANAILQAMATGTFMFVTFIEILPQELNSKRDGMAKFACVLVGFGAISALHAFEHKM